MSSASWTPRHERGGKRRFKAARRGAVAYALERQHGARLRAAHAAMICARDGRRLRVGGRDRREADAGVDKSSAMNVRHVRSFAVRRSGCNRR